MKQRWNRLSLCISIILICTVVLCGYALMSKKATAAPKEIKIACAYPLSGALARNGNMMVQGAKAAMGWVNDNGGIKSLGGAKLVPVIGDTGSTLEGASSAMERLYRDPEIVMAMGSWAGSLTMASTEVSERVGKPHFSISFADRLSARGLKWGFYVVPPSSAQADLGLANVLKLAKSAGQEVKTAMIIGDNNVSSRDFYDGVRKIFPGLGVKIIGEETWAMATLTDATPIMQKVKSLNPDIAIFQSTAISEAQMCLMKRKELGVTIPFICNGGWAIDPSYRQAGVQALEGMVSIMPMYVSQVTPKEWVTRSLEQCKKEYSNEPYVSQELGIQPWQLVPIMAEVLERAASTDPQKIWEAARKMDIHDVMATKMIAGQGMAFDDNGRIAKKYWEVVLVQWQGGTPYTIFPPRHALSKAIWVKK